MIIHPSLSKICSSKFMANALKKMLPEFNEILWLDSLNSTNSGLLKMMHSLENSYAEKPWLLGTYHQTAGRGRSGRSWIDTPGAVLMFSCAFDIIIPDFELPILSPLLGLITCETLLSLIGEQSKTRILLKWPNDIQLDGKKIAGLLVEVSRNPIKKFIYTSIVGIGLNIGNAQYIKRILRRPVADWTQITKKILDSDSLVNLVSSIASSWFLALSDFENRKFPLFLSRFKKVDSLLGYEVNVIDQGRILFKGMACGIDNQGRLLLQTKLGKKPISIGDISIQVQEK